MDITASPKEFRGDTRTPFSPTKATEHCTRPAIVLKCGPRVTSFYTKTNKALQVEAKQCAKKARRLSSAERTARSEEMFFTHPVTRLEVEMGNTEGIAVLQ